MKNNLKLFVGLSVGFFMIFSGTALAGTDPTPVPAGKVSKNYLHISTPDGQTFEVPIKSYKGISLSVLMTLKKQGKMLNVQEPGSDPNGYMTFILDSDVPPAFVLWAQNQAGKGPSPNATGEFRWIDSTGKTNYVFKMTALKVIRFYPADTKNTNGGLMVLDANTESIPPIQFKPQK